MQRPRDAIEGVDTMAIKTNWTGTGAQGRDECLNKMLFAPPSNLVNSRNLNLNLIDND